MSKNDRPYVWQMLREAVEALGSPTTNTAVRDWILRKWPGTNKSTISCHIIMDPDYHASRIHYPENAKPRVVDGTRRHDFFYRPARGELEIYDPARHGVWEIVKTEDGRFAVRKKDEALPPPPDSGSEDGFAVEAHLRNYLAMHLDLIEEGLCLYVGDDDRDGVEYSARTGNTNIGRIDILAEASDNALVVIELKVSRSSDAVVGQIMRYVSWVKRHRAHGRSVRGYIVAQRISDNVRYGVADVPDIHLREYELSMTLSSVSKIAGS